MAKTTSSLSAQTSNTIPVRISALAITPSLVCAGMLIARRTAASQVRLELVAHSVAWSI
ncbi:MAG: hypothetical protein JOZ05_20270 [Acetobacteraceae bacterium]|nr:hypothetical protein [Acetobacteraceae bacterium]